MVCHFAKDSLHVVLAELPAKAAVGRMKTAPRPTVTMAAALVSRLTIDPVRCDPCRYERGRRNERHCAAVLRRSRYRNGAVSS